MKMSTVLTVAAGLALSAGAAMGQSLQFCTPYTPGTPAIPGAVVFNYSSSLTLSTVNPFRRADGGNANELAPAGPFALAGTTTSNYSYHVQQWVAPSSGTFDFYSAQAVDGFLHLYDSTFTTTNALTGVLAGDDDMTTLNGGTVPNRNGVTTTNDSGFRFTVVGGQTYNIVTSSYTAGAGNGAAFYNEVRSLPIPAVPATPTYAIPDNSMTGVSIDLVIANTDVIQSVDSVDLINLVHTWLGDLVVTLTHVETGTTAELIDRVGRTTTSGFGNSGDLNGNYSIVDGGAAWPATAAIAPGTYTQFSNGTAGESLVGGNPLSVFVGESLAGTWRLTVKDLGSGDTGSISAFCLNVTVPAPGSLALLGLGGLVATRRRR